MYRGELMEEAPAADLYQRARHPYTKLLFSAAYRDEEHSGTAQSAAVNDAVLRGEVKTALQEIPGCAFAERCPLCEARCLTEHPALERVASDTAAHYTRCLRIKK
jgi:oligopeptide/dipeptide ABC transporter ATP-binding protein